MAGGAGYSDDGDGPTISEINVTPLVDVVLVLLIVFMITMPTIIADEVRNERELDLHLPQASEAAPLVQDVEKIVINVRITGAYVIKSEVLDRAELGNRLKQAAANNPRNVTVEIRADRNTLWDHVVAVMDLCHQAKIENCSAAVAE